MLWAEESLINEKQTGTYFYMTGMEKIGGWKQIGICFYMKAVKNCVMKTNWHFYINAMEKLCDGIDLLMLYVFCQHVQVAKVDVINE